MLRNLIGKLRSFMIKLKYFKSKTLEYSYSDTVLSGRKIMLQNFPVSQLREHWEDTSTKVKISSKKLCLPSLTSFHYLIHKWNLEEKFGFSWENFLRHQGRIIHLFHFWCKYLSFRIYHNVFKLLYILLTKMNC